MDHDDRVRAWERISSFPLLIASLLFLTAYAALVLAAGEWHVLRDVEWLVIIGTWALFAADYGVRLALSRPRLRFVRTRWLDLLVLVLPLLRPLRVVQTYARAQERRTSEPKWSLEGQVIVYTGLTTLLLGFTASLAVFQVEHLAPGGNIHTYGDSVWWACSTLTGVGYGDVFPVTPRGRVVGVGLMLTGLGLLGSVMGTFSSWLVNRFRTAGRHDRPPGS
jgi:voltage-gated potassium channel